MNKIEFLREYAKHYGISREFGVGRIDTDGSKYIDLFDGTSSKHIIYDGKFLKDGQLYRLGRCTCSSDSGCDIGMPKQACLDNGIYSPKKCAVYSLTELDFDSFIFRFTYDSIMEFIENRITELHSAEEEKRRIILETDNTEAQNDELTL